MYIANLDLSSIVVESEPFHSGKANDIYETSNPRILEYVHSDRISAGNGVKKGIMPGKGKINHMVCSAIYKKFEEAGIVTHYLGAGIHESGNFILKTNPILLEVIGRFKTEGSFCREYHLPKGIEFTEPFVEFTYKCDAEGDPRITAREIVREGLLLSNDEVEYVKMVTKKVAYVLKDFFDDCNAELVDFKIEFGRLPNGQIIIIDEVSSDTIRAVDKETGAKLDKDAFRAGAGDFAASYLAMEQKMKASGYEGGD